MRRPQTFASTRIHAHGKAPLQDTKLQFRFSKIAAEGAFRSSLLLQLYPI